MWSPDWNINEGKWKLISCCVCSSVWTAQWDNSGWGNPVVSLFLVGNFRFIQLNVLFSDIHRRYIGGHTVKCNVPLVHNFTFHRYTLNPRNNTILLTLYRSISKLLKSLKHLVFICYYNTIFNVKISSTMSTEYLSALGTIFFSRRHNPLWVCIHSPLAGFSLPFRGF